MENYDGLFENNNAEPFDKGKWVEQKREERGLTDILPVMCC